MKKLMVAVAGALCACVSLATDYTWTGGASGNWSNPANWGGSGFPNTAADKATFSTGAAVDVTVDDDAVTDGVVSIGCVYVTKANTSVTLHGDAAHALQTAGISEVGATAEANTVLVFDLPLTFKGVTGRQDLRGNGTIKFTDKFTIDIGNASFYNIAKNQVYTGDALLDSTKMGTGNFTMGMGGGGVSVRVEENAELRMKYFDFGNGSVSSPSACLVQDGANTKISTTGNFIINWDATRNPMHYVLKSGTLDVGDELRISTQKGTSGGDYTQLGGTVTVAKNFTLNNNGTAVFSNGTCTVGGTLKYGEYTSGCEAASKAVVYNGMKLTLGGISAPMVFRAGGSAEPAEVHFTKASSSTDAKLTFEPGAKVKLTADAAVKLYVSQDTILPDDLDIGANVTVYASANVQLTAHSTTPPAITIRSGGHFNLHGNSAYIATPIDLTIEEGGQLWADESSYNRGIIVAHSYTLNGVKQGNGRYVAADSATAAFRGKVYCDLYVPYTWTGAAGDNDINNANNWENGQFSYWTSGQLVDFSRATGPIVLTKPPQDNDFVEAAIAYLPPKGREGTLKIVNAEGKDYFFKLKAGSYRGAGFCRRDCTIEFDVKFANNSGADRNTWNGGGTFRFNRELNAAYPNYFVLDGFVEIGSTLTPNANLRFYTNHDTPVNRGIVRFVDGANVAISGTMTTDNNDGFISGRAYEQTGGNVSVGYLCMTATRGDTKTINTYTLGGGNLAVTKDLNLGGPSTQVTTKNPLPTGTFVMTGGTATVAKVSIALNQNWCRLQGGTFALGAAGFVKANVTATQPNATPGLEFGGVTFAAANSWAAASGLDVNFTGEGGATTFDVAAGQTVTLAGGVSGAGGFVKKGAGTLALTGTCALAGDVVRVEAGTVTIAAGTPTVGALILADKDALSLAAGVQLTVGSLIVDGRRIGSGEYAFGSGTVVVSAPTTAYTWIGPATGGNWSDAANWQGGNVPNGPDVELDFSDSLVPATINVDAEVALKSVYLDWGKVTFAAAGGCLTLYTNATVTAAAGAELDFAAETRIARVTGTNFTARLQKKGLGKARFSGLLRSGDEPETLKFQEGAVAEAVEGELEIAGEVAGVHVYPYSMVADVVPTVRLVEGAVMTNRAWVTGVFSPYNNKSLYGAVVMDGGIVRVTHETLAAFNSNGAEKDGKGGYVAPGGNNRKNCFAWFTTGATSFTVNGGRYELVERGSLEQLNTFMNLNNTNSNGGKSTLTVNGGEVVLMSDGSLLYGFQDGCRDEITLNGGNLAVRGKLEHVNSSWATNCYLNLNVGTLTLGGSYDVDWISGKDKRTGERNEPACKVTVNGTVAFAEWQAGGTLTFKTAIAGDPEKIVHLGPGKLVLKDLTGLAGKKVDVAVGGGELDLCGDNGLAVDIGRVDLAGNGKLGLVYAGTENADALYLNGVQRGAGVYGASKRLAARFAGDGALNVLTGKNRGMAILVR